MRKHGVGAWTIVMGILLGASSAGAEPLKPPPSLRETGQVANPPAPRPKVEIRDERADRDEPREQPIPKPTESPRPKQAPAAAGKIDETVLARQIRSRFAALNECPTEVSRHKRIGIGAASAGKLTLRWTILPGGQVADTTVVVRAPANAFVMDCVKRHMSGWSFAPPDGGPVKLERPFSFRAR